ncbi:nucleoside-triphosphatase [Ichthyenterobacterium magnum]|uniref:Nucleoside-triphosphatase THEP1 n=1 Tax=Ichthyenterobacterium magnum TaxID=1230530 RepID=A0A420DW01_9FLAO|nr:nucleoside-triphosphatase [Ichthyenterobacterium magnum]RKE98400.1 nucleoside-triphosphatase THEP1 [Ichthyenterobacterium magnum]
MIYILTGDIRTGKTTALLDWCNNRNDVDGLVCPDNEKGKRYFLKVKSKTTFPLEVDSGNDNDILSIGPFQFLKSSFKKANEYLINVNDKKDYSYLIIDELGKLELKNKGLHDSAKRIIIQYKNNKSQHLILIVRESLLDAIIKHYNISEYSVLKKDDLEILV